MKVVGVVGSPHPGGNSDILLQRALQGAKEVGAKVERLVLADKVIDSCSHCTTVGGLCPHSDVPSLIKYLLSSDLILFSTPVHFWKMSSLMRKMLERIVENFPRNEEKLALSCGGIVVCGNQDLGICEPVGLEMKQFAQHAGMRWLGVQHASALDAGEIYSNEEALDQAYDLGWKAVQCLHNKRHTAPCLLEQAFILEEHTVVSDSSDENSTPIQQALTNQTNQHMTRSIDIPSSTRPPITHVVYHHHHHHHHHSTSAPPATSRSSPNSSPLTLLGGSGEYTSPPLEALTFDRRRPSGELQPLTFEKKRPSPPVRAMSLSPPVKSLVSPGSTPPKPNRLDSFFLHSITPPVLLGTSPTNDTPRSGAPPLPLPVTQSCNSLSSIIDSYHASRTGASPLPLTSAKKLQTSERHSMRKSASVDNVHLLTSQSPPRNQPSRPLQIQHTLTSCASLPHLLATAPHPPIFQDSTPILGTSPSTSNSRFLTGTALSSSPSRNTFSGPLVSPQKQDKPRPRSFSSSLLPKLQPLKSSC